jgi:IclR family KDG regulon transcriptional repressor
MAEPPKYPVTTVIKAIEILNYLAKDAGNRGIGISEFGRELGMGKSTVHRLLDTLQYYGYIDKNEETNRYRLGWQLYSLGQVVPLQNQIFNLDQSHLIELNKRTGETVNLGILQRNETVIISKIEGTNEAFRVNIQPVEHEAVHATGLGKILISEMSNDEIRALLGNTQPLKQFTEFTITDLDHLLQEIESVRAQGYAVDDQEYGLGLYCMARPVRDYTKKIIAAVSVSMPYVRVNAQVRENALEAMAECCSKISRDLGYNAGERS